MDPQRLFGPISTRTVRIDQFDTFILNNIPYAVVEPENVNWGAIEYDGPATPGIDGGKPALQWHFGGVAYPITKAIRINYTYVRRWDGSNAVITTAIYIGLQENLTSYILPQAVPFIASPSPTFLRRVDDLGPFGGFSTHSWASDAGILASEAQSLITRSFPYDAVNLATFNNLLQGELGVVADVLQQTPIPIDLDGPAQDYDSHRPFEYTFATLQNQTELYSQVLFWYFGGKPWRLTKAIRIPLDAAIGPTVVGESVVKLALDENDKPVAATALYGELQGEEHGRKTFLEKKAAALATAKAARGAVATARTAEARAHAVQAADAAEAALAAQQPPPEVVPGGRALFIGYSGPDPGNG